MTYTPNGKALTKFSLAVNRRSKGTDGQYKDETTWFNVTCWERLAETANSYLFKGSKVYVEGRMQSRKYTDKEGIERTAWDVVVTDMEFLTPKQDGAGRSSNTSSDTAGYSDDLPF